MNYKAWTRSNSGFLSMHRPTADTDADTDTNQLLVPTLHLQVSLQKRQSSLSLHSCPLGQMAHQKLPIVVLQWLSARHISVRQMYVCAKLCNYKVLFDDDESFALMFWNLNTQNAYGWS